MLNCLTAAAGDISQSVGSELLKYRSEPCQHPSMIAAGNAFQLLGVPVPVNGTQIRPFERNCLRSFADNTRALCDYRVRSNSDIRNA